MSLQVLSSRAVIGRFYNRLQQDTGSAWIDPISMLIQSNQEIETYAWLGMSPAMREWLGGRQGKGLRDFSQTIRNKHYEATLKLPVEWLRRDKTGQARIRIDETAMRAQAHWNSLLTTLLLAGTTTTCYDGQFYFDTDHSEGDSGTQSNSLSLTLSADTFPVTNKGSIAKPSVASMQYAIMAGITALWGYKDDQGEPMNEGASQFIVMVPTAIAMVARAAVSLPFVDVGASNILPAQNDFGITVVANARLDGQQGWVEASPNLNSFIVFRTDGIAKPLIRQEETPLSVTAIAEGSEHEFKEYEHLYGIDAWRNVGYGFWQHACRVAIV